MCTLFTRPAVRSSWVPCTKIGELLSIPEDRYHCDACGRNQLKLLPDVVMSDECRDCKSATTRELSQGADFRCQQNMQLLCRLCVPFSAGKWHGELLFLQK